MNSNIERENWRPEAASLAQPPKEEGINPETHEKVGRELIEAYETIRAFHTWHMNRPPEMMQDVEVNMVEAYSEGALYEDNSDVIEKAGTAPVFCRWCGTPTSNRGAKACDRCWELDRLVEADPELAQRMVACHKG